MVDRLRRAVDTMAQKAGKLSEAEQDAHAAQLESRANDLRWEELLNDPERTVAIDRLADEGLVEFETGKTRTMDDVFIVPARL